MELARIGAVSCGPGPGLAMGKGYPSGYLNRPESRISEVLAGRLVRHPAWLPPWKRCLPAGNRRFQMSTSETLGTCSPGGHGGVSLPPPPRLNLRLTRYSRLTYRIGCWMGLTLVEQFETGSLASHCLWFAPWLGFRGARMLLGRPVCTVSTPAFLWGLAQVGLLSPWGS